MPGRADTRPYAIPDLVVEARSPSFDVALELDASDTLASPLLPGFAPRLGALFGEDDAPSPRRG